MAEPVFIFGSFSEEEALSQQGSLVRARGLGSRGPSDARARGKARVVANQGSARRPQQSRPPPSQEASSSRTEQQQPAGDVGRSPPPDAGRSAGDQASVYRAAESVQAVRLEAGPGPVAAGEEELVVGLADLNMGRAGAGAAAARAPAPAAFDPKTFLQSLKGEGAGARMRLQPRGLENTGNSCFLNSVLQAMLSCPPFVDFLQRLQAYRPPQRECPTLLAFAQFGNQFRARRVDAKGSDAGGAGASGVGGVGVVDVGHPFCPKMFDAVLQKFRLEGDQSDCRASQEDAQEFLSFLLFQMHDELLHLEGKNGTSQQAPIAAAGEEDDSWETVGRRNKSAFVRTHSFGSSSVTAVFGGKLRSEVKAAGSKPSVSVSSFMLLHLDVQPSTVKTVDDALMTYVSPVALEGYRSKGTQASARKVEQILELPKVLVLHLTRFNFGPQGAYKVHKPVGFSMRLSMRPELLAHPPSPRLDGREFELVATITHHGRSPSGGHYTTNSKQADGRWLHFDDGVASMVTPHKVLQDEAYLLFYKQLLRN